MTPEERLESSKKASAARWPARRELLEGEVSLGGIKIPCAVLDNGKRVLSTRGVSRSFGSRKTGTDATGTGAPQPPPFLTSQAIKPFLSEELIALLNSPIEYKPQKGRSAYGYDCMIFPLICKAIIAADRADALKTQQKPLAIAAHAMLDGLIGVAMVSLIDEATGYQEYRARDALAVILEQFIGKSLAKWVRTFDSDFYRLIFKLHGWTGDHLAQNKPPLVGKITKDIVYSRLAPAVLEELERKNPREINSKNKLRRKNKHHQWLSHHGHPKLREHVAMVIGLMKISPDWDTFMQHLDFAAPKYTGYLFAYEELLPKLLTPASTAALS